MDAPMQGATVNFRQFDGHILIDRYGDFRLTDAIRPGPGIPVVPREGFRQGVYRDFKHRIRIPVLAASVSKEKLFETFLALLEPLGPVVDVVLETSHRSRSGKHKDLRRTEIDAPILASYCCEFEDMLLNDGCTGLAVMATDKAMEVQFDEHKLLLVYARKLRPFRRIVKSFGIRRDDEMPLISEAEHLHGSEPHYYDMFRDLANRIGAGDHAKVQMDEM
ncbi:MAG TPA: hypothetical protein VKS79_18950 [Gemmataceae bacterium]|nr:hypothetical protein [Gemmataceae bacterium]